MIRSILPFLFIISWIWFLSLSCILLIVVVVFHLLLQSSFFFNKRKKRHARDNIPLIQWETRDFNEEPTNNAKKKKHNHAMHDGKVDDELLHLYSPSSPLFSPCSSRCCSSSSIPCCNNIHAASVVSLESKIMTSWSLYMLIHTGSKTRRDPRAPRNWPQWSNVSFPGPLIGSLLLFNCLVYLYFHDPKLLCEPSLRGFLLKLLLKGGDYPDIHDTVKEGRDIY